MEHVSNEQKAKDITKCLWFPQKCTEEDIQNMLMQMAQWKDEQIAQEKQQLIDKAESVCAEMCLRIESELFNAGIKNTNNRKEIEDALEIGYKYFKNAMKGE